MDDALPRKSFKQRLTERIAASRFFWVSTLLHTILLLSLSTVVLVKALERQQDFEALGGEIVGADEAQDVPPIDPVNTVEVFKPEAPTVSAPSVDAITTTSATQPIFKMPVVAPAVQATKKAEAPPTNRPKPTGPTGPRGLGTPLGYRGGTARDVMRQRTGGKGKAEKAVMAGLHWLKKTQNEDGSWADQNRSAMTGLAILCFLGHAELPDSPEFGATVKKGLDWLLAKGTELQGNMSLRRGKDFNDNPAVYEHAIGTYAICEYYTMTKDERYADLIKQAIGYIVEGQAPDGGWQYGYTQGPNSDTSVSGWQIQALKAAHLTGLGIMGVDEALDKAMLDLKRVQGEDGSFGYRQAPGKYTLTGVGVLCTYFWKQDKDRSVRDGIEYMIRTTSDRYPVKYKDAEASLYAWYYNTQACLMFGGSAWSKWNHWFQDEIADAQSADGSWPKTGSLKSVRENEDGIFGQTYRTTLCVLMLEVFYRYMPVTK